MDFINAPRRTKLFTLLDLEFAFFWDAFFSYIFFLYNYVINLLLINHISCEILHQVICLFIYLYSTTTLQANCAIVPTFKENVLLPFIQNKKNNKRKKKIEESNTYLFQHLLYCLCTLFNWIRLMMCKSIYCFYIHFKQCPNIFRNRTFYLVNFFWLFFLDIYYKVFIVKCSYYFVM